MWQMLRSEFLELGMVLGGLYIGAIVIAGLIGLIVNRNARVGHKGIVGGVIGAT